jgi:D-alanyl-lipoteichoic acid acyltransferase DltB (MBOAT superfamily)
MGRMIFSSYDYPLITVIILSALAVRYVPMLRKPHGHLLLGLTSAIALYRRAIFGYLLFVVMLFAFARFTTRLTISAKPAERWSYARAAIVVVLAVYFAVQFHPFDRARLRLFDIAWTFPAHDMWLMLRAVSFLWEFGSGRIKELDFLPYAVWITLPFGLIGPLIRYSEFHPQYVAYHEPPRETADSVMQRKSLALAAFQMPLGIGLDYLSVILGRPHAHWPKFFIIFGTAIWSAYLRSAGSFHLMEALAFDWKIKLPPSFDRPLGQPNIAQFWARWNMTVVGACRDYLFYNRWGFKKANLYINLIIVFVAVRLWHGLNWYWLIWGLMHGSGFCVYLWYRNERPSLGFVDLFGSPTTRDLVSRSTTYIFVCLSAYLPNKIALLNSNS